MTVSIIWQLDGTTTSNLQLANVDSKVIVNRENKYVGLQTIINIPFCNKGSDFDLDKARTRSKAYAFDLIGSFSQRIINSLLRRMDACLKLLTNHANDVEYNDGMHIVYHRKDGTVGSFNVPSYEGMLQAIQLLRDGKWEQFLSNRLMIDQTLKALLNDVQQDHSDEKTFKYSELVSLLCECHWSPITAMHNIELQ